ncbi:MAG: undecaprenyl-diphosphate phosphatase, partial [Bacilli bacterium]
VDQITYKQAFIVGLFQILAIAWPGFSRSASTIIGGWIMGFTTILATEFSFFLAVPMMALASLYKLIKYPIPLTFEQIIYLIVGLVVSYLVAKVVIESFMNYLKTKPMKIFAYYRIIIGLIILVIYFFN